MAEALLIIDFQNDFTSGGALEVPRGEAIAGHINALASSPRFELVVATRDWHPPDHGSFAERGGPWPVHCVQGTDGAELHASLDRSRVDVVLDKGQQQSLDGYSAFEDGTLERMLRERAIGTLTIVGLATDYCVRASALDALARGFDVAVDADGVRGVDVTPGDSQRALDEIRAAGGTVARATAAR